MLNNDEVVIYSHFERRWEDKFFLNYLEQLPASFHRNIKRFHYWEDRQRSLIGKLLLLQVLRYFDLPKDRLNEWETNIYGKPSCGKDFYFNISHSGEWILCSGSRHNQNGIDIEKISPFNFINVKKIMTGLQWQQINNAANPDSEFFRFWTAKESIIKADGRGLGIPLTEINTDFQIGTIENRTWHLIELNNFKGYSAFFACKDRIDLDQVVLIESFFE